MSDILGLVPDPSGRGTFNIFTTCLSVLILCSWTAIHIKITEHLLYNKMLYALMTIFAPEVTLTVAIVELVSVVQHKRKLKVTSELIGTEQEEKTEQQQLKWTLVEGFYALMGGFLIKDGPTEHVASLSDMITLTGHGVISCRPSYSKDIRDKSKADTLSKLITIFQAMWFVIQCIARHVQHLPLSTLELGTLGYVAITFMMYGVWTHKPKDVRTCIVIEVKEAWCNQNWIRFLDKQQTDSEQTGQPKRKAMANTVDPLYWLRLWSMPLLLSSSRMGQELRNDKSTRRFASLVYVVVCISFGVWHCVAWNNYFPSRIEQLLWRISSVLSALPGVILLIAFKTSKFGESGHPVRLALASGLIFVWTALYIFARGFLFVEMFLSLRRMPAAVFETVKWTDFIPHI
ncbi:hypothetical protein OBBRIDRAFT_795147 [Obba rivulosa]|uniref:Uncharacterized protein n=1 Tax=Obba rivulosa TaxID=1052685 RepID=A0A8E2DHS3_9APHY|nr:hypothetical protein OBBRIDRAFT_795147 [Obba rivulosa]